MKNNFIRDAQVDFAGGDTLISSPIVIKNIDTRSTTVQDLDFSSPFSITIEKDGNVHALCGWFDIEFSGPEGVQKVGFSTSCLTKGTHWKQTLFVFGTPIKALKGDVILGSFICKKATEHHRELHVTIQWSQEGSGSASGLQTYNVR